MGSIVLKSLSVLLGIFFLFVGTLKISPVISKELHKDLVRIRLCQFNYLPYNCCNKISKKIVFNEKMYNYFHQNIDFFHNNLLLKTCSVYVYIFMILLFKF